mmetsp:Transcript_4842/g.11918  ORF Transcript_4842/g.11918 Transcript_4842/m.11918 type:complete len:203 (+) Transcript_4842:1261-1869(+)
MPLLLAGQPHVQPAARGATHRLARIRHQGKNIIAGGMNNCATVSRRSTNVEHPGGVDFFAPHPVEPFVAEANARVGHLEHLEGESHVPRQLPRVLIGVVEKLRDRSELRLRDVLVVVGLDKPTQRAQVHMLAVVQLGVGITRAVHCDGVFSVDFAVLRISWLFEGRRVEPVLDAAANPVDHVGVGARLRVPVGGVALPRREL